MTIHNGGWANEKALRDAKKLSVRGTLDKFIGDMAMELHRDEGNYDSGFEAGVLAAEAGLGRAEDA